MTRPSKATGGVDVQDSYTESDAIVSPDSYDESDAVVSDSYDDSQATFEDPLLAVVPDSYDDSQATVDADGSGQEDLGPVPLGTSHEADSGPSSPTELCPKKQREASDDVPPSVSETPGRNPVAQKVDSPLTAVMRCLLPKYFELLDNQDKSPPNT